MFSVVRSVILDRRECVCVFFFFPEPPPVVSASTHFLLDGEQCRQPGHTSFTSPPVVDGQSDPCGSSASWRAAPLPRHMMEHCSAPAPGPPGRLRDSVSKLKPGGWRRETKWGVNCQIFDIYFILKVSAVLEEVLLSCMTSLVILNIDAKIFLFVFIYHFSTRNHIQYTH